MHIYCLSGEARNGKDTVADILMDKLDGKSIKIAMADYLKFMAKRYYGWDGEKSEAGRTLIQRLGTERIRDELGLDTFHAERVCQDIKIIEDRFDYVFIPDVRFRNEVYYTKAKFPDCVTTVHVERLNFKSPLTEDQQNHKSERDLDGFEFDYYIKSDTGLDKVEEQIDIVLKDEILKHNSDLFFKQYA